MNNLRLLKGIEVMLLIICAMLFFIMCAADKSSHTFPAGMGALVSIWAATTVQGWRKAIKRRMEKQNAKVQGTAD